jgi:hypothetical protein
VEPQITNSRSVGWACARSAGDGVEVLAQRGESDDELTRLFAAPYAESNLDDGNSHDRESGELDRRADGVALVQLCELYVSLRLELRDPRGDRGGIELAPRDAHLRQERPKVLRDPYVIAAMPPMHSLHERRCFRGGDGLHAAGEDREGARGDLRRRASVPIISERRRWSTQVEVLRESRGRHAAILRGDDELHDAGMTIVGLRRPGQADDGVGRLRGIGDLDVGERIPDREPRSERCRLGGFWGIDLEP